MTARVLWTRPATDWSRALLVTNEREQLAGLLLQIGVEHRWSPLHRGYGIALESLPDVEAAAQADHWVVRRRRPQSGDDR